MYTIAVLMHSCVLKGKSSSMLNFRSQYISDVLKIEVCSVVDTWYLHLQPLAHVLDEVRRLLSIAKLLLLVEPGPCRWRVLQLHRVKEPP